MYDAGQMQEVGAARKPEVEGVKIQLAEMQLPNTFAELRSLVHALQLPAGLRLYGPVLQPEGVVIEITDGFSKRLDAITLVVPQDWYESGW